MKSSSLKLIQQFGISDPRGYRDTIIHEWYVPQEIQDKLKLYFLGATDSDLLMYNIHDGEVRVNGINYSVVWLASPQAIYRHPRALMSFRYCQYLNMGYVLIKKLVGEDNFNEVIFESIADWSKHKVKEK